MRRLAAIALWAACSAVTTGLVLAVSGEFIPVGKFEWPSFRGQDASGATYGSPPASFNVPEKRNVAWRTPIPGLAHSSPIVWGERIYVTTAVAVSGTPFVKTGQAGIDPAADMVQHSWRLLALNAATGAVIWDRAAHTGVPRLKRHVKASHASATPATNGQVVVALMGSEGLFCFDRTGTLKWKQDLGVMDVGLVDDPTYQWGPASSPVIYGDLVIVQNDRQKQSVLAAFNLETGKPAWEVSRDELPSWATPLLFKHVDFRTELVTNSGKFIRGYEPRTGKELWRLPDASTQVKVPSPIAAGRQIIVTGGYPGNGRPIYAIKPGLTGELTESAALAWKVDRGSPYTPTPLVLGGLLYVCSDNGILSTYDVQTGERIYQQRVSPAASAFSASPVGVAGRVYLTSEDGDVFVVRAGRTFELLATNPLGEITLATPAIARDMVIVRTRHHLVGVAAGRPQ